MTELKITQADRDASAAYWKVSRIGSGETVRRYKAGEADNAFIVQAFARHRIAAEEGKAELVEKAREWVAKLYCASGCSCCRDDEGWYAASAMLGDLLGAPRYEDSPDQVDWFSVRDAALARVRGEG